MDMAAWTPEALEALAAWTTALTAVVAVLIALRHLGEARRLRVEQSQPYVVAYMEPSGATPHIVDLVVRNFGNTAAYHVRLRADEPLERSVPQGGREPVWLFEELPVLVPGQEWRTMWDFGPSRAEAGLASRHLVTILYDDSHGRALKPLPSVLDWGPYMGRRWVSVYSAHDAAKALRDISANVKRWTVSGRGLSVYVRTDTREPARPEQVFQAMYENPRPVGQHRSTTEGASAGQSESQASEIASDDEHGRSNG